MNDPSSVLPEVPSPCVSICTLDHAGVCTGCWRTVGEIGEWSVADRARKIEIRRLAELRQRIATFRRTSS